MKLLIKPPITDISWLKSLPQQKCKTEIIHSTDKQLHAILNQLLSKKRQRLIIPFDYEAPRYILFLKDENEQKQILTLYQGIIWVDEDRNHAFNIGNELWQYLEKLLNKVPLTQRTSMFSAEFVDINK